MQSVDFYITVSGFTKSIPENSPYIHVNSEVVNGKLVQYQILFTEELVRIFDLDLHRFEIVLDTPVELSDLLEIIDELTPDEVNDLFGIDITEPGDMRFSYGFACFVIWRTLVPGSLLDEPFNDDEYRNADLTMDTLREYRKKLQNYIPSQVIIAKIRDGVLALLHLYADYLVKSTQPKNVDNTTINPNSVGLLIDNVYTEVSRKFQARLATLVEEAKQTLQASMVDTINQACRFQQLSILNKLYQLEQRLDKLEDMLQVDRHKPKSQEMEIDEQ